MQGVAGKSSGANTGETNPTLGKDGPNGNGGRVQPASNAGNPFKAGTNPFDDDAEDSGSVGRDSSSVSGDGSGPPPRTSSTITYAPVPAPAPEEQGQVEVSAPTSLDEPSDDSDDSLAGATDDLVRLLNKYSFLFKKKN